MCERYEDLYEKNKNEKQQYGHGQYISQKMKNKGKGFLSIEKKIEYGKIKPIHK